MVEYKEQEVWKCPYCDKVYDSWDIAVECATECAGIDYPERDTKVTYICEYCNKTYEDDTDAEGCEEYHRERKDEFYSRFALKKASQYPTQLNLLEVLK